MDAVEGGVLWALNSVYLKGSIRTGGGGGRANDGWDPGFDRLGNRQGVGGQDGPCLGWNSIAGDSIHRALVLVLRHWWPLAPGVVYCRGPLHGYVHSFRPSELLQEMLHAV